MLSARDARDPIRRPSTDRQCGAEEDLVSSRRRDTAFTRVRKAWNGTATVAAPASRGALPMCGISGEIRADGHPADTRVVARMTQQLETRGPDGVGLWASNAVALGHRRLAIIDLARRGDQPMVDPELERAGYRFFSTSDTEVLLKASHRWGDQFVDRLIGMFALCIVERDSGRAL